MNKSRFRKEHSNRLFSRLTACLLIMASCFLLCSCQRIGKEEPKGYSVVLRGLAGSGYFWNCYLSEDGIVRVESDQTVPKNPAYAEAYPVTFTFTGEHYGEVLAELVYTRKVDTSISVRKFCQLTVDRNNQVTGEESALTVILDPGETGYSFSCTDASVISWIDRMDGSFEVTPLREGTVIMTLTKTEEEETQKKKLVYYMTVSDDLWVVIRKMQSESNEGQFDTMEDLQAVLGFEMPLPAEAEILEIRGVNGTGYVRFRYLDHDFSYVAGDFDMSQFYGQDGKTVVVNGTSVGFPYPDKSLAGWSQTGIGYYVMAEDLVPDSIMLTLLKGIIR